mmetsp:Transcript_15292/g.44399  ORF Transcript_15292/g.44399 Transcript_15292/m.44399 type:complete len:264 (+) Transcript_15292:569-1360(+)
MAIDVPDSEKCNRRREVKGCFILPLGALQGSNAQCRVQRWDARWQIFRWQLPASQTHGSAILRLPHCTGALRRVLLAPSPRGSVPAHSVLDQFRVHRERTGGDLPRPRVLHIREASAAAGGVPIGPFRVPADAAAQTSGEFGAEHRSGHPDNPGRTYRRQSRPCARMLQVRHDGLDFSPGRRRRRRRQRQRRAPGRRRGIIDRRRILRQLRPSLPSVRHQLRRSSPGGIHSPRSHIGSGRGGNDRVLGSIGRRRGGRRPRRRE